MASFLLNNVKYKEAGREGWSCRYFILCLKYLTTGGQLHHRSEKHVIQFEMCRKSNFVDVKRLGNAVFLFFFFSFSSPRRALYARGTDYGLLSKPVLMSPSEVHKVQPDSWRTPSSWPESAGAVEQTRLDLCTYAMEKLFVGQILAAFTSGLRKALKTNRTIRLLSTSFWNSLL